MHGTHLRPLLRLPRTPTRTGHSQPSQPRPTSSHDGRRIDARLPLPTPRLHEYARYPSRRLRGESPPPPLIRRPVAGDMHIPSGRDAARSQTIHAQVHALLSLLRRSNAAPAPDILHPRPGTTHISVQGPPSGRACRRKPGAASRTGAPLACRAEAFGGGTGSVHLSLCARFAVPRMGACAPPRLRGCQNIRRGIPGSAFALRLEACTSHTGWGTSRRGGDAARRHRMCICGGDRFEDEEPLCVSRFRCTDGRWITLSSSRSRPPRCACCEQNRYPPVRARADGRPLLP